MGDNMNLDSIIKNVGLDKDAEFGSATKGSNVEKPDISGSSKSEAPAEKQQEPAGSEATDSKNAETDASEDKGEIQKEADDSAGAETGGSGKPEGKPVHTHEEKERFAWKKLNEKARGYREQIAKLENDLAVLKGKTPAKESDFSNKMDFIQAKVDEKIDARTIKASESEMENLKQQADQSEIEAETQRAQYLVKQTYKTKNEQEEYSRTINMAAEHGMAKILDETPGGQDIIAFCRNTDLAPRVIYHLAKSPDDLVNIVKDPDHSSRMASLRYLERRLADSFGNKPENKQEAPKAKANVPVLGKLGTGDAAGERPSDSSLIKNARKLRYGLSG